MRIRSILASGAVLLAVAGTTVATAGAAGAATAHPRPSPVATGSVALSGPIQYVSFTAVPGRGHHPARGFIDYANFTYPAAGTNVWNIGGTHQVTFTSGGTAYQHTMTVATVTPLSTHSTAFSGTGSYNTDPTHYTWTVTGTVSWNVVSFTIKYDPTSANPGYQVTGKGVISAKDGSVSGTATDSAGNTLPFTMPASSAFQVLKFTAPVTWAAISGHNASFVYKIPRGTPAALKGLRVIVKVHDGGAGFKYDTYAHGFATSPHNGPVTQFPITSGNIFVRK